MSKGNVDEYSSEIPESISVDKSVLKKKRGRPNTIESRRNSTPVRGKVKGNRHHYTDKEKMNAVCVFAVSGNSRRVAEATKIPEATIRQWKTTEWWNEILTRIHVEEDEELDTKLTNLVNKAVKEVNDRLEDGDWVYNARLDKLIRKPINAKDLAVVAAITVDKRQLLRGQPTQRVEKISQDERLLGLAKQFEQFSKAKEVVQVEEEVLEIEEVEEYDIEDDDDIPTVNELFEENA